MKKSDLLVIYAKDHSKEQIVRFASSLFGKDSEIEDGGPGSGNFNHAGRPNQVGGSAPSGGGGGSGSSGSSGSGSSYVSSIITPSSSGNSRKVSPKANMSALRKSNLDTAKACKQKAMQYPKGSHERDAYLGWAKNMSHPQMGRPSPEDSKKLMEENLKNISNKLEPYAQEKYKKALKNEPKITNDLCDIADSIGTEMFGLKYRMKTAGDKVLEDDDHKPILNPDGSPKTVCRIADKIAENQKDARKDGYDDSYEAAVDRLSDLVRYTQACTPDNLVSNAEATMKALEEKGYKPIKVKNSWETFSQKNPYRGVNCVFESPDGTRFELQFHTAESLVGKEVQHGWYEESRTPGIDPKRKAELDERMYNNMASMTAPKDIGRIKNYPPDTESSQNVPGGQVNPKPVSSGNSGGSKEVPKPEKPKKLTSTTRKQAEKSVKKMIKEIGGEAWDGWDNTTIYEFPEKTKKDDIVKNICNTLRENGFNADVVRGKVHVGTSDPNNWWDGIEIGVGKDKDNSAPGKSFFYMDFENSY